MGISGLCCFLRLFKTFQYSLGFVDFKFLYRNAKCLDPRSRKTLSTALIQCYFDYSCSSWYSGLGSGLTKKLQILQNVKVVRFVLDLGPRTP